MVVKISTINHWISTAKDKQNKQTQENKLKLLKKSEFFSIKLKSVNFDLCAYFDGLVVKFYTLDYTKHPGTC